MTLKEEESKICNRCFIKEMKPGIATIGAIALFIILLKGVSFLRMWEVCNVTPFVNSITE